MKPLLNESGGHRWQHVPANDRKGRVHTSTVTCAAFRADDLQQTETEIRDADIVYRYERGRGKGGQNVNKVANCVVIRHVPTGTEFRVDGRNRAHNEKVALDRLMAALQDQAKASHKTGIDADRREKVGSGQRADKIRTYRVQDGIVLDHRSGRKIPLTDVLKGKQLWEVTKM